MNERKLLLGLDLGDRFSQLAVFDPQRMEAELLEVTEENPEGFIETSVSLNQQEIIRDFMPKLRRGQAVILDGKEASPVNVMAYFLRKTLALTKKKYPRDMIKKLVVTMDKTSPQLITLIYEALEKLGISKDRAMVINHKQCFAYFVLYQKKELWINDVGMFDYRDGELSYYQLQLDRRKTPTLVAVKRRELKDAAELMAQDENHSGILFENVVTGLIHKQILSSLFMTGNGFDAPWSEDIFRRLCVGRRLFHGNNLFVSGACYAAKELGDKKRLEDFMLMDDDMVNSKISMEAYRDGKYEEITLVKAGEPWYQVSRDLDLIPDGDEELCLRIVNVFTKAEKKILVELEPVLGRTNRHCRLSMKLLFADANTCVLTMRDLGFGEDYPTSNRIWEKTIRLS
ncbi:MAG: hypothetical protein K6G62_01755 [Eubacterium sp.]|nr:hypothetical protein [Eubacterium sp.]